MVEVVKLAKVLMLPGEVGMSEVGMSAVGVLCW
jgi:hypothetical protein